MTETFIVEDSGIAMGIFVYSTIDKNSVFFYNHYYREHYRSMPKPFVMFPDIHKTYIIPNNQLDTIIFS